MRIFHVSETPHIARFEPRATDDGRIAVWAIDEAHLANYLLPRDCPRVCVRRRTGVASVSGVALDALLGDANHVIYVEQSWQARIGKARLFQYEFSVQTFVCVDANAGYFQSSVAVAPIKVTTIDALEHAQLARGVSLRYVASLWPIHDAIIQTAHEFSCIRLRNAQARQ